MLPLQVETENSEGSPSFGIDIRDKKPLLLTEGRKEGNMRPVLCREEPKRGLFGRVLGMDGDGPAIHIGHPESPLLRPGGPQHVVAGAGHPAYAAGGRGVRRGSAQDSKADQENHLPALHNVHYQAIHKSGAEYAARPRGPRAATGASAQWPADFFHGPPATASPQDKRHFRTTVARTDCNSIISCATV